MTILPTLTILRGRKVATFTDSTNGSPCNQTSYSPSHLQVANEEYLTYQGGRTDQPVGAPPLGDPDRFSDKGFRRKRLPDGSYGDPPERIISAHTFPANREPAGIVDLAERVGACSGLQAVIVGDSIELFGVGTVSDPYCCTEAADVVNQYSVQDGPAASCLNPYPYGLPFHFRLAAVAPGRTEWRIQSPGWRQGNQTIASSFAYLNVSDADKRDGFKGIMACHAALYDLPSGWVYLVFEMWRTSGQSQFVMRYGNGERRQIWRGGAMWDDLVDGAFPVRINGANTWEGNPWAHIISHATVQHVFGGSKYLLLACPGDVPEVALSDDTGDPLTRWNAESKIDLGPFAGTPISDCHYFERDGAPMMYGTIRNPSCPASVGPYPGREVWEFELEASGGLPWAPPVVVPPVPTPDPPPPPPPSTAAPTPPYDVQQRDPVRQIGPATWQQAGDAVYVSSSGAWWLVRSGGSQPLGPPNDGGSWTKGQELK